MPEVLRRPPPVRSSEAAEPLRFDVSVPEQRAELEEHLERDPPRFVHDTILSQLGELIELREPTRKLGGDEVSARVVEHLGGRDAEAYGRWVLLPWASRLVHVLPADEYREVRTARNRYKITASEQERLSHARIGVVGLSVGNMAAVTFALEGIGGHFRVSDFDELSLSNLNRLRAGIADLGVNKTVLAAREMYELDPYLEIVRFPDGIDPENLDDFLLGGGPLDLLVEECDDLYVKVKIRERCRELRIPVIMDTSDRGLLDIERFDLEPERPILHGLIGALRAEELRGLPTREKVPVVLDILGGHAMSTRMAASLPEIDQSIKTWPQLASGVALGGAITADAARRILIGEHTESGRYYVDVEAVVKDGAGTFARECAEPAARDVSVEATHPRPVSLPPGLVGSTGDETIRWVVSQALLSPSAHNSQPWCFVWRDGRVLECRHDPAHDLPTLDFEHTATWLTFGCVAETLTLAARGVGLEPSITFRPDPRDAELVLHVRFAPRAADVSPLLGMVPRRVTNRRREARRELPESTTAELSRVAGEGGCALHLLVEHEPLAEIGRLMGECDRVSAMSEAIHRETMAGYRWSATEVEHHRDGIDIATMELTSSERAGMHLLSRWSIMDALRRVGGGRALEELANKLVAAASGVGLLTTHGTAPEDYYRGGRAVQRLWLTATALGLAFQPMTGLPYLFARVERGDGAGLDSWQVDELRALRVRYRRLFDVKGDHAELLLFRIGYAGDPTAVSLRRPLDAVFTIA